MKKITKLIFYFATSFVLLIIIAFILSLLFFPSGKIKLLVQNKASEALNMPVSIGDIGISFAGIPSIKATDIKIGPNSGETEFLATVESARITVNLLRLFKKEIEIVSLNFTNPEVSIILSKPEPAMGQQAEEIKTNTSSPRLPFPVTLHKLGIKNGRLELEDQENGARFILENIDQGLSIDINENLTALNSTGTLSIGEISLYTGNFDNPIEGIQLELEHKVTGNLTTGDFNIDNGSISLNDLPLVITGQVSNWTKSNFNITSGDISAEKFVKAIPTSLLSIKEKTTALGNFSFAVNCACEVAQEKPVIRYNGNMDIENMSLSYQDFPKSLENLNAHIIFSEKDINIRDLSLNSGNSNLILSGTIDSYMKSPALAVKIEGSIDTEDITGSLPVFEKQEIKGLIDIDLTLDGSPMEPQSIKVDGFLSFSEFIFNLPEIFQNSLQLEGMIAISPKSLLLNNISVNSGKSDCSFQGELGNYMNLVFPDDNSSATFKGKLASNMIDLNSLLVVKEKKDPQTLKPWDLEKTLKTMPVPPNLSIETTVESGEVIFGRLKSDSAKGKITLKKRNS